VNVLAIETSGRIASAAACRDLEVLAEETTDGRMDHGRMLLPLVDRVVGRAGWDKRRDIGLVAVSRGPGSFTGLRVGIACAKALAVLLRLPLAAVCSLDALAENAPPEFPLVLTALDAKRGEIYAAAYERRAGTLARLWGPDLIRPEEAMRRCERQCFVLGDALERHADTLTGAVVADEALWRVRASTVARMGLDSFRAGARVVPLKLEPLYLRLPEAEEKRLARERDRA